MGFENSACCTGRTSEAGPGKSSADAGGKLRWNIHFSRQCDIGHLPLEHIPVHAYCRPMLMSEFSSLCAEAAGYIATVKALRGIHVVWALSSKICHPGEPVGIKDETIFIVSLQEHEPSIGLRAGADCSQTHGGRVLDMPHSSLEPNVKLQCT